MNTHHRPTPSHALRFRPRIALALLSTTLAFQARANVDVRIDLNFNSSSFYGQVYMTATNPAPVTYHRVESPTGSIWRNAGSNTDGSTPTTTSDVATLVDEVTNGVWKLTLNAGDASEEQYAFSVDLANVTTGLFGTVSINVPTYGSTVSTNQPLIEWTGPSHLPSLSVQAWLDQPPYTGDSATLPSSATNWIPAAPLSAGNNNLFIEYTSNFFAGATFSVPTNLVGGATLPDWSASVDISSFDFSTFTVPGAGSALGEAVDAPELSWITGGDGDWFAQTVVTTDGVDAAQSGPIGDFQTSWIETTVQGPGILSFSWGTFADPGDLLEVEWNGYPEYNIPGDWGWDYYDIFLDPGPNTIRWTFYNDDPTAGDLDAAFLDEVFYEPQLFEADFDLDIQRTTQGGSTGYALYPTVVGGSSYATVESPNGLCSGDDSSATSAFFATLQDAINEIEAGDWTIFFQDELAYGEYLFAIAVDSLTTNDLPPVLVLDPLDGAVGVATNADYLWMGPTSFDSLTVYVRDLSPSASLGYASLPVTETVWTNGPALPLGTNSFSASYASNNFAGLTIDEPLNIDTGEPLAHWSTTVRLTTRGYSVFEAGGLAPVVLLSPTVSGGDFGLSFVSQAGATHYVEFSTNLVDGPWMPATNFPGDGTTNQLTLPTTNPAAYYRVQTQ